MLDWKKRLLKEKSEAFEPGETLLAASYYQGRGSAVATATFGSVGILGALAGRAVAKKSAAASNNPEGSVAAQIPSGKGLLAFTDRNLYVFEVKQGLVKLKLLDPVVKLSRQELVGWSYKPGKLVSILTFAFSDGSDVGIEVPRANKPEAFATALGIPAV